MEIQHFAGAGGAELAYVELGRGRPVLLMHGFLSSAGHTWVRFRHVEKLVALGYRVILPDARGHGYSAKPHDPDAYPVDVMADDAFALVAHLGLEDYDLGGYSLGARTTVRMLARGARPGRAIVCGIGLEPMLDTSSRGERFRVVLAGMGTFAEGSEEWAIEQQVRRMRADPVALLHVLDATAADTPREAFAGFDMPILVVGGVDDDNHGSFEALAGAVPNGRLARVPGNHDTAVTHPEFGEAIAEFLGRAP